jgi:hypothetical protein
VFAARYVRWREAFRPENIQGVARLAKDIVRDARTDLEKAERIRDYLRRSGHYEYSLVLHGAPPNTDRLAEFLLASEPVRRRGPCGYFATAFVLLCRAVGLPARLATGLAHVVSDQEARERRVYFTNSDAHAWGEVYFAGYGWVPFEATGPGLGLPPPNEPGVTRRRPRGPQESATEDVFDFARSNWVERGWAYFLKYDRSEQERLYTRVGAVVEQALRGARDFFAGAGAWAEVGPVLAWVVSAVLGGALLAFLWQRQERRRIAPASLPGRQRAAVAFNDELMYLHSKRGFVRRSGQTPREFARAVVERGGQALGPVLTVTESFERVRYGGAVLMPAEREALRAALLALQQLSVASAASKK